MKTTPCSLSAPSKTSLLSLRNLSVGYKSALVKNINLEIMPGDFISIVGANGSGKSTLIKTILGLIPPLSGKIHFDNVQIGYLPQETRFDDNFPATVSEIVLSGTLGKLKFRPFYRHEDRETMENSLKLLGVSKLARKNFCSLSGGQKQKVLLARALSATNLSEANTSLLILDEPSNNLDYDSRKDFYQTLKHLNHDENLTILMITHDLDADDLIGNKVLALKDDSTTLYDTTDYLQHFHPTHERLDHEGTKK